MVTVKTKQQVHRELRRSKGLCGYEGCPDKSGIHYYCADHTKWHREYRRYLRQRAAIRRAAAVRVEAR